MIKKIIAAILDISPLIVLLFLLNYITDNLIEVKEALAIVQSYENNDSITSQILNEVASNNTLLLLISIISIAIFIGIMRVIEKLSDNKKILDKIQNDLAEIKKQTPKSTNNTKNTESHTDYMPK